MAQNEIKHTGFAVTEGKKIVINGVKSVNSFESDFVVIGLTNGGMNIEGKEMKIEDLSEERGELKISGSIQGVYYTKAKEKKGILSGIFG